jgi:hypothetical protein
MTGELYWISITGRVTEPPAKAKSDSSKTNSSIDGMIAGLTAGGVPVDLFIGGPLEEHAERIEKGKIVTFAGTARHFGRRRSPPHRHVIVWETIDFISGEEPSRRKRVGGIACWTRTEKGADYEFTYDAAEAYSSFGTNPEFALNALVRALNWGVMGKIVVTAPRMASGITTIEVPNLLPRK